MPAVSERFRPRAMRLLYLTWLNAPLLRGITGPLMARVFDSFAPTWDQNLGGRERLLPVFDALDRLPSSPTRVLDLGCGNGARTIEIANRFPEAWVEGIDISRGMIDEATVKARAAGAAVRFRVGSNDATGFPDAHFDLVAMINVPPPFAEIHRLLAPGGHVIIVFTQGAKTYFYSPAERLERGFRRFQMPTIAKGESGSGQFFVAAKR